MRKPENLVDFARVESEAEKKISACRVKIQDNQSCFPLGEETLQPEFKRYCIKQFIKLFTFHNQSFCYSCHSVFEAAMDERTPLLNNEKSRQEQVLENH